jgi:hypothetical protein
MKKIILSVLFCCLINLLPATTIVIYITPDFVIMAADSKGVYTNAKTYRATSRVVSKIYKSGNVYFSVAGLTSNPTHSFDVGKIADTKLRGSADLKAAIDTIKAELTKALLAYLTRQKKTNYRLFRNNMEADAYIIENNRPYAHILGFKVKDDAKLSISVDEDFYATSSSRDAVYYLGKSGAINSYMNSITSNNLKPAAFVDKLVNLQITKTPNHVGGPVDIIRMTPTSTEWIRRKKTTPIELMPN